MELERRLWSPGSGFVTEKRQVPDGLVDYIAKHLDEEIMPTVNGKIPKDTIQNFLSHHDQAIKLLFQEVKDPLAHKHVIDYLLEKRGYTPDVIEQAYLKVEAAASR